MEVNFNLWSRRWVKPSLNLVGNCRTVIILPHYYMEKDVVLSVTKTSETFGITNVQIQFISFYHGQREERIFEIYFTLKWGTLAQLLVI